MAPKKDRTYYRCVIQCGTKEEHAQEIYSLLKEQGWHPDLESMTEITIESEEE